MIRKKGKRVLYDPMFIDDSAIGRVCKNKYQTRMSAMIRGRKPCSLHQWIKAGNPLTVCWGEHGLQHRTHGFHHRPELQKKVVCQLSKKFKYK